MRMIITTVLFIIQTGLGYAESADISESLAANMEKMRNKEPLSKITDEQLKAADPQQILSNLAAYENDPDWTVKRLAFRYEYQLANAQPTKEIRQEVACRLVSEIITTKENPVTVYGWLTTFQEKDFSEKTRRLIHEQMNKGIKTHVVLLCGIANMPEELPRLEKLLIDELAYEQKMQKEGHKGNYWYYTLGWRARLARARMGVKADIAKCIELIDTQKENYDLPTFLFPDLGYIRQPETMEYLKGYLYSDKKLPSDISPELEGTPYAVWAMHILANSLENFPVKARESTGFYPPSELEIAKKWASEQTTWKIIR